MDRVTAELVTQAALIAAEREPGKSVGVFLPVPADLGFPQVGDHDDEPHVTVLYIGAVPDGQRDLLVKKVQEVVGGHPPLQLRLDEAVSYFPPSESSDGKRVAKLGVQCPALADLHEELWEQIEEAGIKVDHSFPDFKPHVTLDYIEPGASYGGDAPTGGSWTADAMEIWGWDDPIEVPFTAEATAAIKKLTVYHGTTPENAAKIKREGLKASPNMGYRSPKWYMLADTFEDAAFHTHDDAVVIEFEIPYEPQPRKWPGYPYLWKPGPQGWYALRQEVPAKFIKKMHPVKNKEAVSTATRSWDEKLKKAPKEFRKALEDISSTAYSDALDLVRDSLSEIKVEEHTAYWERVGEAFLDSIDDDTRNALFPNVWAGKQIAKPKSIENKIKRAPKEQRPRLLEQLKSAKEAAKQELIDEIEDYPESHPEFDRWWRELFESKVDEGASHLGEHHEAAKAWVYEHIGSKRW